MFHNFLCCRNLLLTTPYQQTIIRRNVNGFDSGGAFHWRKNRDPSFIGIVVDFLKCSSGVRFSDSEGRMIFLQRFILQIWSVSCCFSIAFL